MAQVCKPFVEAIENALHSRSTSKIIDISADNCFDESGNWVYGLPGVNSKEAISKPRKVSNPECYATGPQLAITLLLPYNSGTPFIFWSVWLSRCRYQTFCEERSCFNNKPIPYSLTNHIHERDTAQAGSGVYCTT